MSALPPPPRPAAPNGLPPCNCGGKRSLRLTHERLGSLFICPRCDYADNQRMGGSFGPLHPG